MADINARLADGIIDTPLESQDSGDESLVMRTIEGIKSRAKIALLALGVGATAITAAAQEVQVASIDTVAVSTIPVVGSEEITEIPAEMQWLESLNLADTNVADIVKITPLPEGIEALKQLASYGPEEQSQIANMYWGTDNFTDEEFDEYMPLIQELRVSTVLVEAILEEAIENGASSRHQRGVQGFLDQLREDGDLSLARLEIIQEYAPNNYNSIPVIIALLQQEERIGEQEERIGEQEERIGEQEERIGEQEEVLDGFDEIIDNLGG